jgi:hypothetical protein
VEEGVVKVLQVHQHPEDLAARVEEEVQIIFLEAQVRLIKDLLEEQVPPATMGEGEELEEPAEMPQ